MLVLISLKVNYSSWNSQDFDPGESLYVKFYLICDQCLSHDCVWMLQQSVICCCWIHRSFKGKRISDSGRKTINKNIDIRILFYAKCHDLNLEVMFLAPIPVLILILVLFYIFVLVHMLVVHRIGQNEVQPNLNIRPNPKAHVKEFYEEFCGHFCVHVNSIRFYLI